MERCGDLDFFVMPGTGYAQKRNHDEWTLETAVLHEEASWSVCGLLCGVTSSVMHGTLPYVLLRK